MKNFLVLGFLTLVSLSYAKEPIEHESLDDAEKFKVEAAVKEKSPGRTFAGDKAKKDVPGQEATSKDEIPTSDDSEVRYWRYSE